MLRRFLISMLLMRSLSLSAFADDPVMGNWEGEFTAGTWHGKTVSANIIGLPGDTYRALLHIATDLEGELAGVRRGNAAAFVGEIDLGEANGGVVAVTAELIDGKLTGQLTRASGDVNFTMRKVYKKPPTLGARPPEGAVVLLDGKDLDAWHMSPGNLIDGALQIGASAFISKQEFGDCKIHIEFCPPYMPWASGQGRGNSGAYVQGRYEIQILDSFGDPPADNGCGGIYSIAAPAVNAALPPGEWQTYDITFKAPHFDETGKKVENAVMTVLHNGVLIHDNVVLPKLCPGGISSEEAETGPIYLQNHGNPVRYRNTWVLPLDASSSAQDTAEPGRDDAAAEALGWRLGIQAWTFKRFTFFEAVDKTAAMGLKYIEAYPGQPLSKDIDARMNPDMSAEARQKVKDKLESAGVKLVCFGVTGAGDEAAWRSLFAFAKDMGVETITSEPAPEQMDLLERLCDEYAINIAIHNHPKESYYWHPDTVLKTIEGRSKRIGACADTGHWMRSRLDPVACLRKLEGRIVSLHFKDLNKQGDDTHDVPWGTGAGNVKAMLEELERQGFKGVFSVEYEHNWANSMPEVRQCVQYFDLIAEAISSNPDKR